MKTSLKILLAVIAVVLAAIVITVVVVLSPKTVVVDDFVTVEISGYDTVGKATLNWDQQAMYLKMAEGMDQTKAQALLVGLLGQKLTLSLDETENLSNGDTVTLKLNMDNDFFQALKLNIELRHATYTVKDLPQANVINPFDYLEISYEGYDPYATASFSNTATDPVLKENLRFESVGDSELSEGERFTVQIPASAVSALEKQGYILSETEKSFTATGLQQPEEIDVFELLTVTFNGMNGSGKITYETEKTNDPFLSDLHFSFSKQEWLSTGDQITCTVSYYGIPEKHGYTLTSTTKTYTVPQLYTYITDYFDLSEENQQALREVALASAASVYGKSDSLGKLYVNSLILGGDRYNLSDFSSFDNFQLTHTYTITRYNENSVGFVFSFDASGHPSAGANGTRYSYAVFTNLILSPDGTIWTDLNENCYVHTHATTSYDVFYEKWLDSFNNHTITEL